MATLTETAYYTRKFVKLGAIFLIGFIVISTAYKVGKGIWLKLNPPPPPAPTTDFGPLPKLAFPEQKDLPELTFKLETIEGGLPELTTVNRVYFMPQKGSNFLAAERAREQGRKMGFKTEPIDIGNNRFRWQTQNTPGTTLEMNIINGNFLLRYDYQNDPTILDNKNLPTNQQAAQEAKSFLINHGYLTDDLQEGTAEFTYLRFNESNNLVAVNSASEAQFIRVNLFRTDLDKLKILPPNPKNSLISFLFSGSRTPGKRILEINYTYASIEKEKFETYPLKTIDQAWEELQKNEGYVAHLGHNPDGKVVIRNVYLAFYDSQEPQYYLQPIFVFKGDRDFYAYVTAIDSQWQE